MCHSSLSWQRSVVCVGLYYMFTVLIVMPDTVCVYDTEAWVQSPFMDRIHYCTINDRVIMTKTVITENLQLNVCSEPMMRKGRGSFTFGRGDGVNV